MNSIKALIWRAEKEVEIINAVRQVLTSLRVLHALGGGIDLHAEIELLTGTLIILGYCDENRGARF
jgi:hypothetical protein